MPAWALWLGLALFGFLGIGRAEAACTGTGTTFSCQYRDEAYSKVGAGLDGAGKQVCESSYNKGWTWDQRKTSLQTGLLGANSVRQNFDCYSASYAGGTASWGPAWLNATWVTECPAGKTWDNTAKVCHDPARCLAMPAGTINGYTKINGPLCHDGCAFTGSLGADSFSSNGNTWYSTEKYTPTGGACTLDASNTPPQKDKQVCEPLNDGVVACLQPNGDSCYEAGTGRYVCWKPGETGTKTDGSTAQKRDAGPTHTPPQTQLISGDTLTKTAGPATTTQTKNGQTSTTNVTNYVTVNGTNAGPTNQGQPNDGSGSGEDGSKGSASGGADCNAPPQCSGDPILCMVADQSWRSRCDGANASASRLGEFDSAINAEGDFEDPAIEGQLGSDGQGDLSAAREIRNFDGSQLDSSGFLGGGSCPSLPSVSVGPATMNFTLEPICELLANVGHFVLAFAYMTAFRIIGGGGRK